MAPRRRFGLAGTEPASARPRGAGGRPAAAVYLLLAAVAFALTAAFGATPMESRAALPAEEVFAHRKTGWQGAISGLCLVTGLAGLGLLARRGTASRT